MTFSLIWRIQWLGVSFFRACIKDTGDIGKADDEDGAEESEGVYPEAEEVADAGVVAQRIKSHFPSPFSREERSISVALVSDF